MCICIHIYIHIYTHTYTHISRQSLVWRFIHDTTYGAQLKDMVTLFVSICFDIACCSTLLFNVWLPVPELGKQTLYVHIMFYI